MVIIKRLKQLNKFMLSLLLVVSLILPSFSSLAGPGVASSDVGDHKIPVNSPHIPILQRGRFFCFEHSPFVMMKFLIA